MAPGHGFSSAVGDNESRTDEDTRTGRTMRGFPTGIRVGENPKPKTRKNRLKPVFIMAPGHGFEPRLDDPESPVLPLDDPGMTINILYRLDDPESPVLPLDDPGMTINILYHPRKNGQ